MLPDRSARMILIGKGLRSFADGYVAVLLPAYLLALGFNQFEVGLLGTLTLAGSALATPSTTGASRGTTTCKPGPSWPTPC